MKYIGMIILTICSTILGLHLSNKSKEKVVICNEFIHLCQMISIDLGYSVTSSTKLIDKLLQDNSLSHLSFISSENVRNKQKIDSILNENENEKISDFLYQLGKSDLSGQKQLVENFLEFIKITEEKYSEKYKKDSKIFITYGFFGGIVVSLIFL